MGRHEARRLEPLPSPLGLGRNLEDDDPLSGGSALARESDPADPFLLGQVRFIGPRWPKEIVAAADNHPALAAGPPPGAQVLEPDAAAAGSVEQILAHPDPGTSTLRLEDDDGLRQATREAREPT